MLCLNIVEYLKSYRKGETIAFIFYFTVVTVLQQYSYKELTKAGIPALIKKSEECFYTNRYSLSTWYKYILYKILIGGGAGSLSSGSRH